MKTVEIQTEYIKLEQFLKYADIIGSGGEAKMFLADNDILVNGETEKRRGKKLRHGDLVSINNQVYKVMQAGEEK